MFEGKLFFFLSRHPWEPVGEVCEGSQSVWVIAGLGNPGLRYRYTRHNVGFLVLETLASRSSIRWQEKKGLASIGKGRAGGQDILLVKPQTYMNNSGKVLCPLMKKKGEPVESLIVVHDDLDLPWGRLKIKRGGGHGGHKGVLSIQEEFDEAGFLRVKMGIGRPRDDEASEMYVLSPFSEEERQGLGDLLERGAQAVECILLEGSERAMNRFHGKELTGQPVGPL